MPDFYYRVPQNVVSPGALATEATLSQLEKLQEVKAKLFNDYAVTPVTTGGYIELSAGLADDIKSIEIFDSSGELLTIALGGAGSEVDTLDVQPGGNDDVKGIDIPAGTRISIKALSANATVGFFSANLFGDN